MKGELKLCKTPGCTHFAFHIGPHSNECRVDKGDRKFCGKIIAKETPTRSPTAPTDKYKDIASKQAHRALFLWCAMHSNGAEHDERPVLYLDGEAGGLTRFMLDNGFPPKRLVPCNNNATTCAHIKSLTGVDVICADIEELAMASHTGMYRVVWFDMTGTNVQLLDVAHVADYVQVTVNTRTETLEVKESVLRASAEAIGLKAIDISKYRGGTSRSLNMVHGLFWNSHSVRDASRTPDMSEWLHVALRIPLQRWEDVGIQIDPKRYPTHNGCLDALVTGMRGSELLLAYLNASGQYVADQRCIENLMPKVTPQVARAWVRTSENA